MKRSALALLLALVSSTGCVRHFTEPSLDQPHALMKIRIVHHVMPGPMVDERVTLNGELLEVGDTAVVGDVQTRVVRIPPVASEWRIDTRFFHTVQEPYLQTYYVTETYACSSYQSGGNGRPGGTVNRTCTRQVPRQRQAIRTVEITDAECGSGGMHVPLAGAVYVMQVDFYGHTNCNATCLRQLPGPMGSFTFIPCGENEPRPTAPIGPDAIAASPPPT